MTPVLSATQRILHILPPVDPGFVVFQQRDTDTDEVSVRLAVTSAMWADLGEPGVLTVKIQPGDLLNEE